MNKRLKTFLILTAIMIAVDWLSELAGFMDKPSKVSEIVYFLTYTFLIFLVSMNLTYPLFFNLRSHMLRIFIFISLSLTISMFLANRILATTKLWQYASHLDRLIDPFLLKEDPKLGYRAVKNAKGKYDYYLGDSIHGMVPVLFDSLGFRTTSSPVGHVSQDSVDLFLGCSFTFGNYIKAEETFAVKTSTRLGHTAINAGMSGYGLSQMYYLADTLLKARKFRYVFIQMSRWLVDRSLKINRTSAYGYQAVPYFSSDNSDITFQLPAYPTVFHKKAREWFLGPKHYMQKLLFVVTDGFLVEFVDYTIYSAARIAMKLNLIPAPANDRLAVEKKFYDDVIGLAKKQGAIPVIVKVSYSDKEAEILLQYLKGKALIADADKASGDSCLRLGKSYKDLYTIHHAHKNGPIPYDGHPNDAMTNLISDVIISELNPPVR